MCEYFVTLYTFNTSNKYSIIQNIKETMFPFHSLFLHTCTHNTSHTRKQLKIHNQYTPALLHIIHTTVSARHITPYTYTHTPPRSTQARRNTLSGAQLNLDVCHVKFSISYRIIHTLIIKQLLLILLYFIAIQTHGIYDDLPYQTAAKANCI